MKITKTTERADIFDRLDALADRLGAGLEAISALGQSISAECRTPGGDGVSWVAEHLQNYTLDLREVITSLRAAG